MMLRSIRRGMAYGWYTDEEIYNVYFKDTDNEISYKQHEQENFEYLNESRYNTPLFPLNAINEFFSAPLKAQDERDTDGYEHASFINMIHIELVRYIVPISEHVEAYQTYRRLLELYAEDEAMEYKPFAVLKIVYEDGKEEIPEWMTSEMYGFLSEDEALMLDLSEPDCLDKAELYFSKLTMENHMEGIVIKPEIWNGKTVPYMKVRNPDYLSIIYGYDYKFPHKYRKLLKQMYVNQKLRTSLKEYQMRMLAVPFDENAPEQEALSKA